MGEANDTARLVYQVERKYRRFSLSYPVRVKLHLENSDSELEAVTKNVSIGGLLLEAASSIPQHSFVSFVMTVEGGHIARPIKLLGDGEVVRVEGSGAGSRFAIAVKCAQPIAQMEEHLAASGT